MKESTKDDLRAASVGVVLLSIDLAIFYGAFKGIMVCVVMTALIVVINALIGVLLAVSEIRTKRDKSVRGESSIHNVV